jgi:D-alanyl-D-alanine carboxypeptidase (penicillin-binding protein 5/6)
MRLVAVVLGEPDAKTRNSEVGAMFTYGFNHFQVFPLYKKGDVIQIAQVDKGKRPTVNIVTSQPVSLLAKKGEKPDAFSKDIVMLPSLQAPVKKTDVVGHIFIKKDGKEIARIDLRPDQTIEQAGMWEILKRSTRKILISYE